MNRLNRFQYCNEDLIEDIKKVLQTLDKEDTEIFLEDESLQIVPGDKLPNGFLLTFSEHTKTKTIIYISLNELNKKNDNRIISHEEYERLLQSGISNAIKNYFVGLSEKKQNDKVGRFEHCSEDLKIIIRKTLNLIDKDKKEKLLKKGKRFQITDNTTNKDMLYGFQITFKEPVQSLAYINFDKLKNEPEENTIYCIAHEIGHHFAGRGKSGLLEKEANDWLYKWGNFKDIIKKVNDQHPINEDIGYKIGYEWAYNNDTKKYWSNCKYFLPLWEDKDLRVEKVKQLENELMRSYRQSVNLALEEHGKNSDGDNEDIIKGVAFGIFKRVRELANKK